MRMSIGTQGIVHWDGESKYDNPFDYDIVYLVNGMSYITDNTTKTNTFSFGIAWINDIGWDDPLDDYHQSRANETWFGADPTMMLGGIYYKE